MCCGSVASGGVRRLGLLEEDDLGEFVVDVVDFLEVEPEHDAQFLA